MCQDCSRYLQHVQCFAPLQAFKKTKCCDLLGTKIPIMLCDVFVAIFCKPNQTFVQSIINMFNRSFTDFLLGVLKSLEICTDEGKLNQNSRKFLNFTKNRAENIFDLLLQFFFAFEN